MKTMRVVVRMDPSQPPALLYLATECGHVQWFTELDISFGLDNEHCQTCNQYGVRVTWLKVWVEK